MRKNSKAQQEAIGAMLLIVITVAAFAMVWNITQNWVSQQRQTSLLRLKERLVIENVLFEGSGASKKLAVFVLNTGEIGITIFRLIVNGSIQTQVTPTKLTLGPKVGGWINATFPWSGNVVYEITLETERGARVFTFAKS
ncbi:MAG: hypothetical protein QXX95_05450 [Nitrososphaerales archaeon]